MTKKELIDALHPYGKEQQIGLWPAEGEQHFEEIQAVMFVAELGKVLLKGELPTGTMQDEK